MTRTKFIDMMTKLDDEFEESVKSFGMESAVRYLAEYCFMKGKKECKEIKELRKQVRFTYDDGKCQFD